MYGLLQTARHEKRLKRQVGQRHFLPEDCGCRRNFVDDFGESFMLQSVDGVNKLFGNKAARRSYAKFSTFKVHDRNETSILSVARLNSITATIIDSFVKEQATEPTSNGHQRHKTSHTETVCAAYDSTNVLIISKQN